MREGAKAGIQKIVFFALLLAALIPGSDDAIAGYLDGKNKRCSIAGA